MSELAISLITVAVNGTVVAGRVKFTANSADSFHMHNLFVFSYPFHHFYCFGRIHLISNLTMKLKFS